MSWDIIIILYNTPERIWIKKLKLPPDPTSIYQNNRSDDLSLNLWKSGFRYLNAKVNGRSSDSTFDYLWNVCSYLTPPDSYVIFIWRPHEMHARKMHKFQHAHLDKSVMIDIYHFRINTSFRVSTASDCRWAFWGFRRAFSYELCIAIKIFELLFEHFTTHSTHENKSMFSLI